MGRFPAVPAARLRKTALYFEDRPEFFRQLNDDIWLIREAAIRLGFTPAIRLNLTSDILWERYGIPGRWPDIQFYDYTKVPARKNLPPNYHLTFSFSGHNLPACLLALSNNINVAIPFKAAPSTFYGYPVIDGDAHDLRFLDPKPRVVALKPKGKLRSAPKSLFLGDNHANPPLPRL